MGGDAPAWCAGAGAAAHVLVAPGALDAETFVVDGDDGHHLARVRRVGPGERVTVADGHGRWRTARVAGVDGPRVVCEATGATRVEPVLTPRLVVAFVPAKGDQPEGVVRSLTELGVDAILVVESERSVVRWGGTRAERAVERLTRIAREAALQSRRARVPAIARESLTSLAGHPALLAGDPGGVPVARGTVPDAAEWLVVIGPEGGLTHDELASLRPAARLAVGPHVLRAATAPVALASALAGFRAPGPRRSESR